MANPGLNTCIFSGNLGQDPKIRETRGGEGIMATAALAVGRMSRSQDGKDTDWMNLVAFDKQAEILRDYTQKGSFIEVVARCQNRTYDKDGETKYVTEFVVNEIILKGTPKNGNGANGAEASDGGRATQAQPSGRSGAGPGVANSSAAPPRVSAKLPKAAPPPEGDDDLPF